jgi:hypothetical protein
MTQVDYILKDGSRGVWDYEAPKGVDLEAYYRPELPYINQKLKGKLRRLVFVTITESDTGTLDFVPLPEAEPDWSQQTPDRETVFTWMRERAPDFRELELLAFEAHEHFHRPYHIMVLLSMAVKVFEEAGR